MQIFVRPMTGEDSITLDVKASNTIDTIKGMIQVQWGVPKTEQRLLFAGVQLEDGSTLSDYGIRATSSLILVFGAKGNRGREERRESRRTRGVD